ncbi:mycothiol system anti-sigma-R factor [Jatrophihabitans cynanchi]|jgi:mycothiol system anti-sigma-R factor|uniref:Mycothiol system anti-sigma-R factor n=1 Tax=Jatrophihabitans cynanchi TaxID=2944128 RepID=A0ABY7JXB1_9ACTN|nr:mycothiol system anti-sigma-R factor [Jatrophihabitans sp. SB3-54]WAX56630.1 mycothiol system anti-sigma-R factor [Jatrophihabitans sp. SB3-54]
MSGFGFGPGNIDCDDVLKDLYLYLDDESDDTLRNRIRQHLEGCAPCLKQYGLEQDVRALVTRCCGGDHAPASLHERIRVRITEMTIEFGGREFRAD